LALVNHGQPGVMSWSPQSLKHLDDRLGLPNGLGGQGRAGVGRGGGRLTQRILAGQQEPGAILGQLLQREPRRTAAAVLGQADELEVASLGEQAPFLYYPLPFLPPSSNPYP
jgi:hypothetical protein